MATTLTAVACDGRRVVLGHLGDSRAYVLREGALAQVSRDHTFVQQLVDEGQLAPADVASHPWRNVVLRSLHQETGASLDDIELTGLDVSPGDRIMLCSDGLSDLVTTRRMQDVLRLREPQSAAAVLVQSALLAGGRDNVTCLVLDVLDGPPVVGDGMLLGAAGDFRNVVDPASVRAV
jgi:protein phosphatase